MTVWWYGNPSDTVTVCTESHTEGVITSSRQWTCIRVEKLVCCFKSNDIKMSPNSVKYQYIIKIKTEVTAHLKFTFHKSNRSECDKQNTYTSSACALFEYIDLSPYQG